MTADDRDVLTSLPRTRPTRRSAKRGGPVAAPATPAAAGPTEAPAAAPIEPAEPRPRASRAQAEPPAAEGPAPTTPPAGWASAAGEHDRWSLRGGGPLLRPALRATGGVAKLSLGLSRRMLAKLPKP